MVGWKLTFKQQCPTQLKFHLFLWAFILLWMDFLSFVTWIWNSSAEGFLWFPLHHDLVFTSDQEIPAGWSSDNHRSADSVLCDVSASAPKRAAVHPKIGDHIQEHQILHGVAAPHHPKAVVINSYWTWQSNISIFCKLTTLWSCMHILVCKQLWIATRLHGVMYDLIEQMSARSETSVFLDFHNSKEQ